MLTLRRDDAFLGHQLDEVRQRLQQSVRTHAVRSGTQLNVRQHLALDPRRGRRSRQKHDGDQRGFDEAEDEEVHSDQPTVSSASGPLALYSSPGRLHDGVERFRIRPSVPDVNSVSSADRISSGLHARARHHSRASSARPARGDHGHATL